MKKSLILTAFFVLSFLFGKAIDAPVNYSPTNGVINQPVALTIDWSSVSGNTGYIYQLDTTPLFNSPILREGPTTTGNSQATMYDLYFGTKYYWRAATKSAVDTSAWSATWDFTTANVISNYTPTNGATNQAVGLTLDWSSLDGNTGYIYQLDTTPLFNSPILREGPTTTGNSQATMYDLYFGTKYYWRAATKSAVDTSAWSATWDFTTADVISNYTPTNAATNQAAGLTLDWSSLDGNTGYLYQVDTVSTFDSPNLLSSTTAANTSQVYISNLYFGKTYYWRCAVKNGVDTSNWTSAWSFVTTDVISNYTPTNAATNQAVGLTLDWSSLDGNTGYLYQVDTVSTFDSPNLLSSTTAANTSQVYISNLYFGKTYYWRCAVRNGVDTSNWTSAWSFVTTDVISNYTPTNAATNQAVGLTLDWSSLDGNTGYLYQVDTVSTFDSPNLLSSTTAANTSQIYISNLYFGKTYYWRCAVKNGVDTSNWTSAWSFVTTDVISNYTPTNAATNQAVGLTLDWSSLDGNTGYLYQVDTVSTFDSPNLLSSTTAANTSQVYISNLYFGKTYYWRCAVKNGVDTSNWTSAWSFTTGDFVTNYTPANGAIGVSVNPTLDWSSFPDANGYLCRVDTSLNFNSIELQTFSSVSSQTGVSGLLYGAVYYWQAAAKNAVDTSSWNTAWAFTTAYQLTVAPLLVSPANTSTNISYTSVGLVWNTCAGASGYQYQYSSDPTFATGVTSYNTSLVTGTISGLYPHTVYYWRVRGSNANGYSPWSTIWNFTTESAVLVAPQLVFPSNNANGIDYTSVTLDWNSVFGASQYIYQFSPDENFVIGVTSETIVPTQKTLIGLSQNSQYFWRVKASDGAVESDWSATWNFTTQIDALDAPILVSPLNNATAIDFNSVILDWNSVDGASEYTCEYSIDNTFATGVVSESLSLTNKTINGLSPGTQYFWRVMASNGSVDSDWSEVWDFTTDNEILAAPLLVSPSDNTVEVNFAVVNLVWESVFGATQFTWQLSTDNLFITDVQNGTLPSLTVEVLDLLPETEYFWRVMASSGMIESDWSEVWSFTTEQQIVYYILTINIEGAGIVYVDGEQYFSPVTVEENTELTLQADFPLPWPFVQWLGDVTGSENPETIIMDGDKEVTAEFIYVGIEETSLNAKEISIYPNPACDKVIIYGDMVKTYVIFSLDGRQVLEGNNYVSGNQIDISGLKPGVYFIKVNNSESGNLKLIKE